MLTLLAFLLIKIKQKGRDDMDELGTVRMREHENKESFFVLFCLFLLPSRLDKRV